MQFHSRSVNLAVDTRDELIKRTIHKDATGIAYEKLEIKCYGMTNLPPKKHFLENLRFFLSNYENADKIRYFAFDIQRSIISKDSADQFGNIMAGLYRFSSLRTFEYVFRLEECSEQLPMLLKILGKLPSLKT